MNFKEKWKQIMKATSTGNCPECQGTGVYGEEYCLNCHGIGNVTSGMGKAVGIEYAGPVPESKLAEQDLERETSKGAFEQTGKKLDALSEKAEDVETVKQKSNLIARIGRVQIQRQKAVIDARKNGEGSFKNFWRNNNHG